MPGSEAGKKKVIRAKIETRITGVSKKVEKITLKELIAKGRVVFI